MMCFHARPHDLGTLNNYVFICYDGHDLWVLYFLSFYPLQLLQLTQILD